MLNSLILVSFLAAAPSSAARELSVADVLVAAEQASPELKAAAAREAQARDAVELGKSYYYPTLDAEGIQSYGFAGSNGALGLGGILSSPFRSGLAGGVVSRLTLFDLGRGYGMKAAKARLDAARAQTRVVRYQLDQAALRIYFDGARYRGQEEAWEAVGRRIETVSKEVQRLVRTGQHSPVEGLLVQDQAEDAAMRAAAFAERYRIALRRLGLITGLDPSAIACPPSESLFESSVSAIIPGTSSPGVERAQAEAEAAGQTISLRSAGNYPTVTALASAGGMDGARLVDKKNYSGGFGVRLPIFEGFKTSGEVSLAKNAAAEREFGVLAARLDLDEANASYDDAIESSRVKLKFLDHELGVAQKAFELAIKRYLSFEGPLVDVRESIRDIARIQGEASDAKTDLLLGLGAKAVLNGGRLVR